MTFFVIKRIEKLPSAFLHLLKTEIFKFKIRFLFCFILYLWTTGKDFSNIFNLINGSIQHFWQTVTNTIIYWDWVGWNTSKRYLWFVSSQHTLLLQSERYEVLETISSYFFRPPYNLKYKIFMIFQIFPCSDLRKFCREFEKLGKKFRGFRISIIEN